MRQTASEGKGDLLRFYSYTQTNTTCLGPGEVVSVHGKQRRVRLSGHQDQAGAQEQTPTFQVNTAEIIIHLLGFLNYMF